MKHMNLYHKNIKTHLLSTHFDIILLSNYYYYFYYCLLSFNLFNNNELMIVKKQIFQYIIKFVKQMNQFDCKLIAQAKKTKGYLLKKSNTLFSKWKKRYFIVLQDNLSSFQDQTLQSTNKIIKFSQITHIESIQNFQILVQTHKKIYYLKCSNQGDQDLWTASLHILKQNLQQKRKRIQKSSSKSTSKSHSKHTIQTQSFKSSNSKSTRPQNTKQMSLQKISYVIKQKQVCKFLLLFNMERLLKFIKDQQYLRRILFIQDKQSGFYFSVSSKSIYNIIDENLIKQEIIYPYQLNVLYFVPYTTYKNMIDNKQKHKDFSVKLNEICKFSEVLQCSLISKSQIRIQIHCQKPLQIQSKFASDQNIANLVDSIRKAIQVGLEYWNPKGKLLKNIDVFLEKYYKSDRNQLVFYRLVESQFDAAKNFNKKPTNSFSPQGYSQFFSQFQEIILNLKHFIDACDIKSTPLHEVKQNFVKLYHKFVYNHLNKSWNNLFRKISDDELISYSSKVYSYYQTIAPIYNDIRVKQGCKSLLNIAFKNFNNSITQLIKNFDQVEEQSLKILKKIEYKNQNQQLTSGQIFFSTFCTNFVSIFTAQFKQLTEIPKHQQFFVMAWAMMRQIFKSVFQRFSVMAQDCKVRSSLISICNSLKFLKHKRIPQLFMELQKTPIFSFKKEKQQFLKEINFEISQVETFCVKKLFVITFSSIDRQILKHQIKSMDFQKICSIVIVQISKLEYILPQVRIAMHQAAFEEVCYFFYICVTKFDNKTLSKDECISMINLKLTTIKDEFTQKVDQQKIMSMLKDLNLLKQFITCPSNNIKNITRQLKKTFGCSFSQLTLKNLISLRTVVLKQRQYIFEQCRDQIKSSYTSNQEIQSLQRQSLQRQSFFNSSYRQQRKSTLTQSLVSYGGQIDKSDKKFMFQNLQKTTKQGYLYRKKIIKNIDTTFSKYYYRLYKGKLLQYDDEQVEDHLNCYLLTQLNKCFLQPERNNFIHLEFDKHIIKFKVANAQEASKWYQKILQAVDGPNFNMGVIAEIENQQGVLFQDFTKKITFQTKQTTEATSPNQRNPRKHLHYISPDKANNDKSANKGNSLNKRNASRLATGLTRKQVQKSKHKTTKSKQKPQTKKQKKGCGTGCNFL